MMLTNINIDAVLILRPLLTELHKSLLGAQGGLELILHIAPSLVLRGQELPHLTTPLWRHTYK